MIWELVGGLKESLAHNTVAYFGLVIWFSARKAAWRAQGCGVSLQHSQQKRKLDSYMPWASYLFIWTCVDLRVLMCTVCV